MVTPIGTLGTGASDNADPAISRLLSSLAFTHARRRAEEICCEAEAVQSLVAAVRQAAQDHDDMRVIVEKAEPLLQRVERVSADPDRYDRMSPGNQARHRLLIAAVVYLAREDDVIPDSHPAGTVDDLLVLTGVVTAVRDAEARHSP